jgi:serine/threonine-protein kinase
MQERMVSHYKIIESLGGGAMGKVFKAEDTLLHRLVALKFLPADLTEDEEASRRFMREARATSSLDHPNICTIHEIAQAEDGSWYIAMAWYEGQTLKKILDKGPLPPDKALDLARQMALGLSMAHDQDIVHRDIKPANIIITDRDELKILDFGLARLLGKARLTRTGTVMGTAAYMSPEQARGEDVGTSSDIWSLGVVLYEMLSGRVPFEGESDVAMIYSVLNIDPPALPEPVCRDSAVCTGIVHNCLARDPRDRYPSARIMAEDIERAMGGSRTTYDSKPSRSSVFAPPIRSPWRRLLPVVFVLALLVALAFPQSRRFLRSVVPFAAGPEQTGVAVIPFTFTGDGDDADEASAFGRGLGTMINDRLSRLEQYSGRFWVVPTTEIMRRDIADSARAVTCPGVELIITGEGNLSDGIITLQMTVYDRRDHSGTSRKFHDFAGNLKTWRSDLLSWLTEVIDPDLKGASGIVAGLQCTNIPASFLAYQHGFGHLVDASGDPDNPHADAALSYLERAVASDSSFACAWTQLGRAVWLKYGITDSVRVSEIETYLATAARLDSTSVWPRHFLGNLKASTGDSDDALTEYRLALDLDPLHAPTLARLGLLQNRRGENKGAEATFHRAINARPRYPRAYRNAGVFHYYQAEYENALQNFKTMVDLVPNDPFGHRLMGATYFEKGDYENSEIMFNRSLALEESYGAYSNLGTLYFYDQRYTDSIAMCRKALELQPDEFNIWRTMAASFKFAPGYEDSVRPTYEKAMELLQIELARDPHGLEFKADHAAFCAILGPRETALAILADLETNISILEPRVMFSMASTYEELGDRNRALDWLETAVNKDLSFKKVDHYPTLMNLRSHPRYIALRKQYGE